MYHFQVASDRKWIGFRDWLPLQTQAGAVSSWKALPSLARRTLECDRCSSSRQRGHAISAFCFVNVQCQTPSKRRTNERTDERTDARNRIWCILALKCDIWWRYFNDVPDNQLTKLRVFIGWFRIFIPSPLIFLQTSILRFPVGWTSVTDTTDKLVSLSVRSPLRWSFGTSLAFLPLCVLFFTKLCRVLLVWKSC